KLTNNQQKISYSLFNRASALWRLGRYDDARALFTQARAIADAPGGGFKSLSAEIYLATAEMELSQRHFPQAKAQAEQAQAAAGTQYQEAVDEAKRVIGLVESYTGKKQEGERACQESLDAAMRRGDTLRISRALLALAESKL